MAVEVIGKLKPKNNGSFPVIDAIDVQIDEKGTRLSEKLIEIENKVTSGSNSNTVVHTVVNEETLKLISDNSLVVNETLKL